MTLRLFTPKASSDLEDAADWIAAENPAAARVMLAAALAAARMLDTRPGLGRARRDLAPDPYRFWLLRGFPYMLVHNSQTTPIRVMRFLHTSRNLPAELYDIEH